MVCWGGNEALNLSSYTFQDSDSYSVTFLYCHCHSLSSSFVLIYSALTLLYLPFLKVLLSTTPFLSISLHLSEEMGSAKIGFSCHRNRQLIISLLFILVSSSTLVRFTAEGKSIQVHCKKLAHKRSKFLSCKNEKKKINTFWNLTLASFISLQVGQLPSCWRRFQR